MVVGQHKAGRADDDAAAQTGLRLIALVAKKESKPRFVTLGILLCRLAGVDAHDRGRGLERGQPETARRDRSGYCRRCLDQGHSAGYRGTFTEPLRLERADHEIRSEQYCCSLGKQQPKSFHTPNCRPPIAFADPIRPCLAASGRRSGYIGVCRCAPVAKPFLSSRSRRASPRLARRATAVVSVVWCNRARSAWSSRTVAPAPAPRCSGMAVDQSTDVVRWRGRRLPCTRRCQPVCVG